MTVLQARRAYVSPALLPRVYPRARRTVGRRAGIAGRLRRLHRSPLVGSSMKTMDGLATSSTAMVRRLRASVLRPPLPAQPTIEC